MLIEFRVANYRSFKDEQVLSMVAGKGTELQENTFTSPALKGRRLLKSAIIYGANAAGKSNLVRAMEFFSEFVEDSANRKPGDKTGVEPFLLDPDSREEPSTFEVSFIHPDADGRQVRYRYGFSATPDAVTEEWLYAYPKGHPRRYFTREVKHRDRSDYKLSRELGPGRASVADRTRKNALYLSRMAPEESRTIEAVLEWFRNCFCVLDFSTGPHRLPQDLSDAYEHSARLASRDEDARDLMAKVLREADLGIKGVQTKERDFSAYEAPDELKQLVTETFIEKVKKQKDLALGITHESSEGRDWVNYNMRNESAGTQKLFALNGKLFETWALGYTLVVDELHSSLHPALTRWLINLFHSQAWSNKGAQLIFPCHDTTLLDNKLFRRDQVWFVEKNHEGATTLYSLYDFRPRKGERFQRGYLQGRYGAIPFFGEFKF